MERLLPCLPQEFNSLFIEYFIFPFLYSKRELLCLDFVESSNDFYLLTDVLFIKLAAYFLTILF